RESCVSCCIRLSWLLSACDGFVLSEYVSPLYQPPYPTRRPSDLGPAKQPLIEREKFQVGLVTRAHRWQEVLPPVRANQAKCSTRDRKSTRLNSSHVSISYAVFSLKKNISQKISRHMPSTAMTNTS